MDTVNGVKIFLVSLRTLRLDIFYRKVRKERKV